MEIGVFAEVFASPAAARTVLEAAGLSRADHPAWETARLFWSEVSHLLKAGALTDGRAALFAAAGALFPANPVFTAAAPARPGAGPGVVLPVWRVPWPRNPNFVGRGEELAGLQGRLAAGAVSVLPQALQGLGGVGKTQLAVEYAHRSRGDYDLVWWLNAEQPADLVAGLADLAGRLGVAVAGAAAESVERVVSVLAAGRVVRRWLLLVDNAGVPSDLQGLLAAAGVDGHVLVTSRDPGWAGRAQTVAVDVLSRADAVRLLQSRALRLTGAEADRVADLLGDLPLAVEQAGTWLASTPMTAQDYCTLVAKRAREILAQGTPAAYPVPVAATWTAAVDRLDDPAARWLLWLWACCGPEPIPADLISAPSVELLPAPLDAAAGDPLRTGQLVSSVVSLGLVRITADGIVMHRLVQTILRDHTPPPDRDTARDTVHRLLAAAAPETSELPESWQRYAALRPHIVASEMMDSDREDCRATVIRLINYLNDSGDYPTGLALTQEIHSRWHHRLGEDHPDTLTAAESLAGAMWSMGDYPAARGLVEGVLARRREILGEDHPDTLRTAGNLASTLRSMGDYPAARSLEEGVLARRREILGEDHPDTLRTAGNLASTLRSMGDYPAARSLEEGVLARRREILGEDHPDTLRTAGNLASTLWSMGDYPAARGLIEDVLARSLEILGQDHPDTLTVAANLAGVLGSMGDYPAARGLIEDVLARSLEILGEDHPDTLRAAENLAVTLRLMGDYPAARGLNEEVLARRLEILGQDHPDTVAIRRALANYPPDDL